MGRPFAEVDMDKLEELGKVNLPRQNMAGELGISHPTLTKIIGKVVEMKGILMKYRELQSLQLTAIQARILEHITPERISEASLRDLVLAFKILKDKEQVMEGKPSDIKGLVGYLIELERQESNAAVHEYTDAEVLEALEVAHTAATVDPTPNVEDPDFVPDL